ncbi:TlpA disulfide reductase family protein [Mucilaginibacter arboris]|uniref:Redoxin domain-containing protein n=1 Tax=Mucilaginibacter arboris TaxID=2682090 RepID=A0A7K1T249_9SPHI|nr:TlpA disulfide reductase family protein [Mucilaginibacter arboris]MVN23370.1 redoxin domain-containing protein [Mucilaginibacter arboris]
MKGVISVLLFISMFTFKAPAQNKPPLAPSPTIQSNKLKAKVEANPSNLETHRAFINSFKMDAKFDNPEMEMQYKIWIKQFPKEYAIPFAIGEYYVHKEIPKAAPYLLQASILKPDNAEVWDLLANDALFTNNNAMRQNYLNKAVRYAPNNADYAFYYANSFKDTDPGRYDSLSLEVARRFPESERGVQALYWLASNTALSAEKIAYYKQIYNRKSNQLSDWYLNGTIEYFDLLLQINPEQAFDFGLTMILEGKRNRNLWKDRVKVADTFLKARKFLAENDPKQALALLNQVDLGNVTLGSYIIDAKESLALFKAEAADAAKQTRVAFDTLAVLYSKEPTDGLHAAIYKYGSKLGMDSNSVAKTIWKIRDSKAKQAADFSLQNYLSGGKSTLSDFRGKVILLTYWFPGCEPCRAEFPHFESVLKNFNKDKVAYLGLNLFPSQNEFVLPFLKETGYTFTPLQDDQGKAKGNLEASGAPTNYLIDQKGRIVFSGFKIDAENEKTLELMIRETLAAKD